MNRNRTDQITIAELKKRIIANAVATGNAFAFRDLFSCLGETPDISDDSGATPELLGRLDYLLPAEEALESPEFASALELIERHEFDAAVPATVLEETAKHAVRLGKFSYAEDAYKLLGIKKEIVALYAQAGEQLLRDDKPNNAAMSSFGAATIDQPMGPQFQYFSSPRASTSRWARNSSIWGPGSTSAASTSPRPA